MSMDEAAFAETLPRWSLDDLYKGNTDPKIEADLAETARKVKEFRAKYEKTLLTIPAPAVRQAIEEYEHLSEILRKLSSYAMLQYSTAQNDKACAAFYQKIIEKHTEISGDLLFFTLTLNKRSDLIGNPELQKYQPWLKDLARFKPHQLSDAEERIIHEKEVTGAIAWVRLYDETLTKMKFTVDGKQLTLTQVINLLSDPDAAKRQAAGMVMSKELGDKRDLFALIYNTLVKDKAINDKQHYYKTPTESRHLENCVEPEVVEALKTSVRKAYPRLSHRYYTWKAKRLGKERLEFWDRTAPLPDVPHTKISWEEARKIVLESLMQFSPEMAKIGQTFFDKGWIDAQPRDGKRNGAYAHPVVPSVHPYLFLNYDGEVRGVTTLAHELGHTIHMMLSNTQGLLQSDTPLTLSETASVFGEMLVFRALLARTQDKNERRALLAGKIEDMLGTVIRQIAFFTFEEKVHAARAKGELLPEDFEKIWMEVQSESLGAAIHLSDEYKSMWSYVSHFFHMPFYVYAYAFGDCLVNSLYAVYQKHPEGFAEKYIELLKAGGTKHHKELLEPFGLNAADPAFWDAGLQMIEDLINELEALD